MVNHDYMNELYHHGTKGQRWGIRRYQNPDGSLTAEGKRRRGQSSSTRSSRQERKIAKARAKSLAKARQAKEEKKQAEQDRETKKSEILKSRSALALYKNADLFTTQELHEAYNRLSLEQNISNLSKKEVERGTNFVKKTIDFGKTVNDFTDTGIKLYNNFAKIYNVTESGKENPWRLIKDGDGKKK